jgi:hypothetical protein
MAIAPSTICEIRIPLVDFIVVSVFKVIHMQKLCNSLIINII